MSVYEAARQYKLTNQINDIHDELKDIKADLEMIVNLLDSAVEYQCKICKEWFLPETGKKDLPMHARGLSATVCEGTGLPGIEKRLAR